MLVAYFNQLVIDLVLSIIISQQPAMKVAKAIIILALVGCCFSQVLANTDEAAAASNLANYYGHDLQHQTPSETSCCSTAPLF